MIVEVLKIFPAGSLPFRRVRGVDRKHGTQASTIFGCACISIYYHRLPSPLGVTLAVFFHEFPGMVLHTKRTYCTIGGEEALFMQTMLRASDVRSDFKQFIDSVIHDQPVLVQRHKDSFLAVSLPHIKNILSAYRFTMEFDQESDGSFSGSAKPIDVVANAPSIEELRMALARELIDYAKEYEENFGLYYRASNRKDHLPYILRVLLSKNEESVAELIDA